MKLSKRVENLTKHIFERVKINRFVLLAYLILPALIVAVGFATWTISGNDSIGTSGGFVTSGVINSNDYISINSSGAGFDLFETGFYDTETKVLTKTPSIGINYKINLKGCYEDLLTPEDFSDGTASLYGEFVLMFPSGSTGTPAIFENMILKIGTQIVVKDSPVTNWSGASTVTPVTVISVAKSDSTTNKSYTFVLRFDFTQGTTYTEEATLSTTYTINNANYSDIYNYLVSETAKHLVVDVKITDYSPL